MPATAWTLTSPLASLVTESTETTAVGSEEFGAKTTVTPDTGLPKPSAMCARSGRGNAVSTTVLCGVVPASTVRVACAPAVLASSNSAGAAQLADEAVTSYGPAAVPAVAGAWGGPFASGAGAC